MFEHPARIRVGKDDVYVGIANARIDSFGISPRADIVSRSEEPVFILTAPQLQAFILRPSSPAGSGSPAPATVDRQDAKIAAFESTTDREAGTSDSDAMEA